MKKRNGWLYAFWILIIVVVILALMVGLIAWSGARDEDDDDKDREPEATLSIELSESSLSIAQGLTVDLTVTIDADDASDATIAWASSDSDVASVVADTDDSAKATVAGNTEGSATITVTVTIDEETVKAECSVTVTAPSATDIELDATSMSVAVGDENTLTVTSVTMSDGTTSSSQELTWASSDESVATVEGNGNSAKVTAVGKGATTISVTAGGGATVSASCAVTVSERLAVPDATNDADALKLNDTESFEGYDYTVESTTITSVDEETGEETQEAAYLITGTASAMTESIATWYNGGGSGAAKNGDSYIVLKIFVGIGNTISYTSYGESEKSYTNEDGAGVFDGDYFFVCERLTGVYADGSQVQTLDGVSYTITDGSGNVREEVSIIFDITTVAWDGVSVNYSWDTTTEISQVEEYTIYSAEELAGLAHLVNDDSDWDPNQEHHNSDSWVDITRKWTIKLGANIDLGDKAWEPIGGELLYTNGTTNYNSQFRGTFDGQGHTIYNLNVSKTTCVDGYDGTGLFGFVGGGAVENVTIENVKSSGLELVGGLIGVSYEHNSYDEDHTVNVDNCHLTGHIEISGHHQVGGIVGSATASEYTNCTVEGDGTSFITSTYDKGSDRAAEYDGDAVGGIVGFLSRSAASVTSPDASAALAEGEVNYLTDCTVSGMSISGCRKVGGLIGHDCGCVELSGCTVKDTTISLVYNTNYSSSMDENTASPKLFVGALVGEFEWHVTVTKDCTVSNVTVNYLTEYGISANYTPAEGDDNPYKGLFGGSRNQAGYEDSPNKTNPYTKVIYATDSTTGVTATVDTTGDFTMTKITDYST